MAVTISYKATEGCAKLTDYVDKPVQAPIESTLIATAQALKNFPELRRVQKSNELIDKVSELLGQRANPETVTRSRRHIQNKLKLHLPLEDDGRRILQEQYRGAFR